MFISSFKLGESAYSAMVEFLRDLPTYSHVLLGQFSSMCHNGENGLFPNDPFKVSDQYCEIVSCQMDWSAPAPERFSPAVINQYGADCEQLWGCGVYFSY